MRDKTVVGARIVLGLTHFAMLLKDTLYYPDAGIDGTREGNLIVHVIAPY